MSFKPSEISAIGGIGVRKKTGDKLIISFQGRLEVGSGIFAEFANKDLTFRQMSVQANFLLGITF